jgi:hypothetical protein
MRYPASEVVLRFNENNVLDSVRWFVDKEEPLSEFESTLAAFGGGDFTETWIESKLPCVASMDYRFVDEKAGHGFVYSKGQKKVKVLSWWIPGTTTVDTRLPAED